jgi:hypothetical protein
MDMINQQGDCLAGTCFESCAFLLLPLQELLIELDQQEHLILNIGRQIVLSDEFEYIRSSETEEKWESFPILSIGGITRAKISDNQKILCIILTVPLNIP